MSNNNTFWGKRFGFIHKDGTPALVKRQLSSGRSNTGVKQNESQTAQSKRDQAMYKANGRPTIHFDWRGKRIFATV
jgi:hypothetical protein